jgi:hypothetical protein
MNAPIGALAARDSCVTIEEIQACSDLEQLSAWYLECDRVEIEIRAHLDSYRAAGIKDEDWCRRSGGALAFRMIARRHLERRILTLGGEPPYQPTDPRAKAIRCLQDQVAKLKKQVGELGGDPH